VPANFTEAEPKTFNQLELRLVTVQVAAKYLSISVSTLYGWVWQRKIPFVKIGRVLRFDLVDLDRFIEANRTWPRHDKRFPSAPTAACYNTHAAGKG
jgi:excisionase family DNA binding protein